MICFSTTTFRFAVQILSCNPGETKNLLLPGHKSHQVNVNVPKRSLKFPVMFRPSQRDNMAILFKADHWTEENFGQSLRGCIDRSENVKQDDVDL